jgi:Uma2 family endonuclease
MATATRTIATGPAPGSETRILAAGVSWDFHERFVDGLPEASHVRAAFDGEDMEIMVKGPIHEDFRALLGWFVEEVAGEAGIPFQGLGETTWKRGDVERGLEADQCFYFDPAKVAAARASLRRRENDVAAYPNPDLAVEIDISPSLVDRPAIYAALGVAEVWRFDGETPRIEILSGDGSYQPSPRSRFLPVAADEVREWITADDAPDRPAWSRRLRDWAAARAR